jgi:hypothetical protein
MRASSPSVETFGPPLASARARALLRAIIAAAALLAQFGCATSPDNIPAAPVPVARYLELDCGRLEAEFARVGASLRDAYGLQSEQASNDSGAVAGALLVFTPAILAVGGNRPMQGEVARLKGEQAAISDALAQKNCPKFPRR